MTKKQPENKRLLIIGAGGHGRVVADCAESLNQYDDIAFLDDCYDESDPESQFSSHWSILGKVDVWPAYLVGTDFIIAFGRNDLRLRIQNDLKQGGGNIITLIHPSAVISQYAKIGVGTVVFAGAVINLDTTLGEACIVNTSASIDHDCTVGHGVHISPNVSVAGGVTIGELSWLGIGCTIIQYLNIAPNCQMGAGTVVIKDITEPGLYVGSPARKI